MHEGAPRDTLGADAGARADAGGPAAPSLAGPSAHRGGGTRSDTPQVWRPPQAAGRPPSCASLCFSVEHPEVRDTPGQGMEATCLKCPGSRAPPLEKVVPAVKGRGTPPTAPVCDTAGSSPPAPKGAVGGGGHLAGCLDITDTEGTLGSLSFCVSRVSRCDLTRVSTQCVPALLGVLCPRDAEDPPALPDTCLWGRSLAPD